jgi:hypothetical protein
MMTIGEGRGIELSRNMESEGSESRLMDMKVHVYKTYNFTLSQYQARTLPPFLLAPLYWPEPF